MVAILYMFNIVGSITMTIQPIYGLFEKREKDKEEDAADLMPSREVLQRGSINSQTGASTIILNTEDVDAEVASDEPQD